MGKANASLPDPLTEPTPALAGTDDLLSQLAGDEIDRLLAEADVSADEVASPATTEAARAFDAHLAAPALDPARQALDLLDSVQQDADAIEQTVREMSPAPAVVPESATGGGVEDELKALFAELNEPLPALNQPSAANTFTATASVEADAKASASLSAEIDDLFKQLTADQPAIDATAGAFADEAPAAAVQPAEPATDRATEAAAALAVEPDAASAMQERAGLGLAGLATSVATAPQRQLSPVDADDAPLPLLLRPLEWMNAPLAGAGESMRDLVGKAAIVTFVNAAAVLAYVMLFRK
jgi:hypothetical protein